MANTLLLSSLLDATNGTGDVSTANTTQYFGICGATATLFTGLPTATEAKVQVLMRSPGTLSNMWIRIVSNNIAATPSITIRSRVNTANGNQVVQPGTTATGAFTDSTHTDILAAGALVALQTVPGAATNTFNMSLNSFIFAANTNTISRLSTNCGSVTKSTSTTTFSPITGDCSNAGGYAAETTGAKCRQLKAGTFQNACVNVTTNTVTANSIVTGRINAGPGAISVTCTASTTGFFEDTTHLDAVTVGQDYDTELVTGATGTTFTFSSIVLDFSSTIGDCQLVAAADTVLTVLKSVTDNFGVAGSYNVAQTELNAEGITNAAFTFSNISILITANTVTLGSTLKLRANAANPGSGPSAAITLSTIGVFSDTVNTYVAASTDLIDFQLVTGTTGTSLKFAHMSILGTLASAAAAVIKPLFFTTKTPPGGVSLFLNNTPPMFMT